MKAQKGTGHSLFFLLCLFFKTETQVLMFLLCSDLEVVPAHCVLLTLDYKHLCHLHTWQ